MLTKNTQMSKIPIKLASTLFVINTVIVLRRN